MRAFDRPKIVLAIRRWRDKHRATPRAADMGKQVLWHLLSFAGQQGLLTTNPCARIENLYDAQRSEIVWTADDFTKLEAAASAEVGTPPGWPRSPACARAIC